MARRKTNEEHIRNIQKSSGMYYISIPVEIIRDFRWQERQKVVVRPYGDRKIIIEDWEE